jgi:hypothetical protein
VSHGSVTNNQIIHKHQTEKNFSSSHPQFARTEIPSITDFPKSHALLILIIFLNLPATEIVFSV